ncbi:MAG: hypothetical protein R6U96_04795, partial [Promethearchaeia archaeon]
MIKNKQKLTKYLCLTLIISTVLGYLFFVIIVLNIPDFQGRGITDSFYNCITNFSTLLFLI